MALCCTRTRATPSTHIVKASAVVNTPMSSSAVRSWPVGAYWPARLPERDRQEEKPVEKAHHGDHRDARDVPRLPLDDDLEQGEADAGEERRRDSGDRQRPCPQNDKPEDESKPKEHRRHGDVHHALRVHVQDPRREQRHPEQLQVVDERGDGYAEDAHGALRGGPRTPRGVPAVP